MATNQEKQDKKTQVNVYYIWKGLFSLFVISFLNSTCCFLHFFLFPVLVMNSTKEAEKQEERELENTHEVKEDEAMGQEDYEQSKTPEKMASPVDQLQTPKLSDFGLSALQFQRVFNETEPSLDAAPVPTVALSPPPFVMNMHAPQPKTPKCSLRMEEDAPTPRLEDFGISENTMCWNNDFTMDLFNKKPQKKNRYPCITMLCCDCYLKCCMLNLNCSDP